MEQNFGTNPGKKTFRESADGEVKAVDPQDGNHPAEIMGKEISDQTGWYELYIEKNVPVGSEVYMLTFAMDLGALYEKIVAPVKIGEAGYSSVKDQNMNIIMHHVKNQIGLKAVDGRIERYPYLDMSSLNAWIMRQENEDSGTGVIDTYVWDDPGLKRVRRVVAFQATSIQGERWIVNSTLPVHELSGPLESMMAHADRRDGPVYDDPCGDHGILPEKPFSGGIPAEGDRIFKGDQSRNGDAGPEEQRDPGITSESSRWE